MQKQRKPLSPIREVYCIKCYTELNLNLEERRSDKDIICSACKSSFSLKKAKEFKDSISDITSGKCPNCSSILEFDLENRITTNMITCPDCKQDFYIDETESPENISIEKNDIKEITSSKTDEIIRYFHPKVDIFPSSSGKKSYYIKADGFNHKAFKGWFISITITLAILTMLANPTPYGYTFTDWIVDFIGWTISYILPASIVALIIGYTTKADKKLSQAEISIYKERYKTAKQ